MKKLVRSVENHWPVPLNVSDFSNPFYLSPNQKAELFVSEISERKPDAVVVSENTESKWFEAGELTTEDLFIIQNYKYDSNTGSIFNKSTVRFVGHKIKKKDKTYLVVNVKSKRYYLHRIAWFIYYGEWPDSEIDHIDGNSENNRISNLRLSDRKSNGRNIRIDKSKSKSKFCGVNWHESGKWRARVKVDGKEIYLGLFDDVEEAAKAVKEKRSELGFDKSHGEDRPIRTERNNFIDAAESAFKASGFDKLTDFGFLYDAGFRLPESK